MIEHLEPDAAQAARDMAGSGTEHDRRSMEATIAMSNAISLKRIADIMTLLAYPPLVVPDGIDPTAIRPGMMFRR